MINALRGIGFRGKLASASLKHGDLSRPEEDFARIPRQACLGLIEAFFFDNLSTGYHQWIPRQACLGLIEACVVNR